ncbi:glycine-rich RNA-binding protein 3, mitochondrial-like [Lucilia sericata]|uniref:glycine-rich RNA-binding protein 3, mitochondrial-like n=1 Tax=Lucilia sericata TaxID=13632 RepID=UPI0018A81C2E|nr:glycine-rich RNA-binding protein 3, mitochondrial-like [Lucilia sericata]
MKSVQFVLAGVLIVLSHVLMSAAQGQGGYGGSAGTWSSSSSQSGQPGTPGNSQFSYGYGGVDANGMPYGGSSGNGGYHVNITDEQGRQHSYSGGQGGFGGQPGQHGQPGQPGSMGTYSYSSSNTNRGGYQNSSSSSAYASAWSTFYVICLFSLFLIIKS